MDATSDCEIPERVLLWAAAAVDPNARIHSVRRLHGGVSSLVHNITFQVGGAEKEVVLRQFTNREWLQDEPDLAHHEAESLRLASRAAICTPQIIAYDESGSTCGIPAVLMTRIEGKVILEPMTDMEHWIDGLAAALVRIHHVDADGFAWSYFTYNDVNSLGLQSWSSIPEKWTVHSKL
ncbi:phosphotransferase family protein [Paenibacillus abyssi]|uniref:Aminoglycoside phosphotransferase domain-containing protein n=1 Tax=Paenibacillus abyssi TaxID=1340531 RepID=A0A917FZE0_9BACL|nr:aminoglycoside phosphotransferase family protein [Paenibacillus abyssi]GGG15135.1 hypothetical protein GCM10010916_35040 [Paenibacillus abyssi]